MSNAAWSLVPPPGARFVVCGGRGGIGRAFINAAHSLNLQLIVLDLAAAIEQYPCPTGVEAIACDATREDSVRAAFAGINKRWEAIDGLVHLTGFTNERKHVEVMQASEWDEIVSGNLRSAFLLARSAIPLLRNGQNPCVTFMASTFGVRVPYTGYGPYSAAKAGLINLTRALAVECAPTVRVNSIAPGVVETAFLSGGTGRKARSDVLDQAAYRRTVPLGRIALPDDIVGPLLFISGPGASFINGQTLHVNGGTWS